MSTGRWIPRNLGPRLAERLPISEYVNPANGCYNGCGEARANMLRTYTLVYEKRVVGRWRLCSECFVWGSGPPDPDPLQVPENAA